MIRFYDTAVFTFKIIEGGDYRYDTIMLRPHRQPDVAFRQYSFDRVRAIQDNGKVWQHQAPSEGIIVPTIIAGMLFGPYNLISHLGKNVEVQNLSEAYVSYCMRSSNYFKMTTEEEPQ